jgi:signal transduction histidine kinase
LKITDLFKRLNLKLHYISALFAFIAASQCCNTYGQQREIDSLRKALVSNLKADTTRVNTLNQLAYDYYTTNLNDLRTYGDQALQLAKQLNYASGEALAYKILGLGYLAANANPIALDYFDRSLKIFVALHDKLSSARVLNNIGYYYGIIKDRKQELDYFLQAYDEAKGSGDMTVISVILGNVGNTYEATNELQKAREFYNQELAISQKQKQAEGIAAAYGNLASIDLKEKNYTQALVYCDKVLEIQKKSDNFKPRDLANIYTLQGEIYYNLKSYNKARQVLTESLAIASNLGYAEYQSQNYYNFYLLDSVKGDYRSALKDYYQYTKIEDSLTNVNKSRVVTLYQIKFESQRRDAENQRLKIEDEKNETIISQQHTTQIVLTIGLLVILGGAVYLFNINKQVKAKSEIINQQNQVLENNNVVKDKLFSVISHDLRSPITQVVGLLNLWEAGEMNEEEMSALTPTVKSSIIHTLELLDNLLIWSKNQLQGFHFNPLVFDLRQLTEENLKGLKGLILKKAITVENGIQQDTMVYADMEMIKIVLRNLMSNAIKFTPDKGTIRINSTIKDGYIIICVEDTGIGIKEKDQSKIFSFTSHTTLGTANEKGTGIGLKICRDFIELNKGNIWMESEENVGSKFYVSIPVNAANV